MDDIIGEAQHSRRSFRLAHPDAARLDEPKKPVTLAGADDAGLCPLHAAVATVVHIPLGLLR